MDFNTLKNKVLNGELIQRKGWAIQISEDDRVEIWPPKGAGFSTDLMNVDRAVKDFAKKADIPLPGKINETQGDAVSISKDVLEKDTSNKDVKSLEPSSINEQPPVQGSPPSTGIQEDSTNDDPGVMNPEVSMRPRPEFKSTTAPSTKLDKDRSGKDPEFVGGHKFSRIQDTFGREEDPTEIYRKLRAKKPSAELLEGIADPEGWAARRFFAKDQFNVTVQEEPKKNKGEDPSKVDLNDKTSDYDQKEELDKRNFAREATKRRRRAKKSAGGHWQRPVSGLDYRFEMLEKLREYMDDTSEASKTAGPRIKEKWDDVGGYGRDLEAESAEELHALVRALGGEEVDWAGFRPATPDENMAEETAENMQTYARKAMDEEAGCDKESVDDEAKDYYKEYFGDYGKQLTKGDSGKGKPFGKGKSKGKGPGQEKDAQAAPAPQEQAPAAPAPQEQAPAAPAPQAPAAPAPQTPAQGAPAGPQKAPQAPKPKAPAGPQPPAPGTGDSGLESMGLSFDEIQRIPQDVKQHLLQILQKDKAAPGQKDPATPAQPAPQTPAPQAPAGGSPVPQQNTPTPSPTPNPEQKQTPMMAAYRNLLAQMEQAPVEEPAPAAPADQGVMPEFQSAPAPAPQSPAQQSTPAGGMQDDESKVLTILQEIQQMPVQASSPEQVAPAKMLEFQKRLMAEVGWTLSDAAKMFSVKNVSSLFK